MIQMTHFPYIYEVNGVERSTRWVRTTTSTGDPLDEVEAHGEAIAAREGAQVDVLVGFLDPQGRIVGKDRLGIRVNPPA